jgi:hypothetical protein
MTYADYEAYIEKKVEQWFDSVDQLFMSHSIDLEEYNLECKSIREWADRALERYRLTNTAKGDTI